MPGERTLVISLQGAGNLVMATPMIRALSHSGRRVHLAVASLAIAEFMSPASWVDTVSWPEGGFGWVVTMGRSLRRERFSTCVSCYPNGRRAALVARMAGARDGVGFVDGLPFWLRSSYSTPLRAEAGLHDVEQNLRILDALSIPRPVDTSPSVPLGERDREFVRRLLAEAGVSETAVIIAVHPGGASTGTFRRWPADRYARLAARMVKELGASVALLGDPSERRLLEEVSSGSGSGVVVASTGSIGQSAAVIERSSLLVGNDSGPLHIASALGVPVVGLYGPTDETRTAPYGEGHTVLTARIPCRPCYEFGSEFSCGRGTIRCLELISVDDVFDAVRGRLESQTSGS